ncbi:hypothetical protein Mic7113_1055 [Allocoleopsis franciscana PCC 7113]|uniref:Uncharacterized protein n=1 Tax=Allocoleopsis franciscana PCC 7113 TaxID=1173027 RepID=K9WAZ9_9CYAN|nr:hypothetical protein Mic7113_1055 [Allocoleopsis franciscana PCC 7113]
MELKIAFKGVTLAEVKLLLNFMGILLESL